MDKISTATGLRAAILLLEARQAEEEKLLKRQFHLAYESMKPVNLILNTVKDASESKELKDNILNTVLGLAAGSISKILFDGVSKNPLTRMLGVAVQFGVTNVVAKHPEAIKSLGTGVLKIIRSGLISNHNGTPSHKGRGRLDLM